MPENTDAEFAASVDEWFDPNATTAPVDLPQLPLYKLSDSWFHIGDVIADHQRNGFMGAASIMSDLVLQTPFSGSSNNSSYLGRSLDSLIYGNYSDQAPTALSVGGSIGLGLTGLDVAADIRDLSHDFSNWQWTWSHAGNTTLDAIGVLPVVGVLKNADEVADVLRGTRRGAVQTIEQRAADLVTRNGGKNRVSIRTPNGRVNIDLQGRSHGGIDTPHVATFRDNIIPSGPRAGQVGNRSQVGPIRPATNADFRIVDRLLESRGQ